MDRGVRGFVTLGKESNESRDVFLELREVKSYIVLVELHILMVDLRGSDSELEFRVAERGDHSLDVLLNFDHLVLDFSDLGFFDRGVVLDVSDLLSELLLESTFLFLGKLTELFVSLDLTLNVFVEFSDNINLTVEVVDVVNKRVVLLLGLAEGGHDFFVGADTGLFLNLLEGILNNLDVSNVHIHKVLFLLVVGEPFSQTTLEELNGVGELGGGRNDSFSFLGAPLFLLVLVTLFKLLLELHDFLLEDKLIRLVLRLEGQDLVVGLLRMALTEHDLSVHFLAVLGDALDLTAVAFVDPLLFFLLLTHDIDFTAELLVLSLEITVLDEGFIELVLVSLNEVVVSSHLGRGRADDLQTLLLLLHFLEGLLVRVFQDHKFPKEAKIRNEYVYLLFGMLKLLSEVIGFALKALCL